MCHLGMYTQGTWRAWLRCHFALQNLLGNSARGALFARKHQRMYAFAPSSRATDLPLAMILYRSVAPGAEIAC